MTKRVVVQPREGSRQLQTLTPEQRASAVHTLADLLVSKEQFILDANAKDLSDAQRNGLAKPLMSRLSLSTGKLKNLSVGLKQIADSSHKMGESMDVTPKPITIPIYRKPHPLLGAIELERPCKDLGTILKSTAVRVPVLVQ
uniref:Uncharacterized protein n=1 Tax=Glossina brevipalpis TaxID=37001 RepID=A0A1A9WE29_9MUSC